MRITYSFYWFVVLFLLSQNSYTQDYRRNVVTYNLQILGVETNYNSFFNMGSSLRYSYRLKPTQSAYFDLSWSNTVGEEKGSNRSANIKLFQFGYKFNTNASHRLQFFYSLQFGLKRGSYYDVRWYYDINNNYAPSYQKFNLEGISIGSDAGFDIHLKESMILSFAATINTLGDGGLLLGGKTGISYKF